MDGASTTSSGPAMSEVEEVAQERFLLLALLVRAAVAAVLLTEVALLAHFVLLAHRLLREGAALLVEAAFGVHQPLQLTTVEEDAAAAGALIDGDPAALVAAHRALALRADELAHARDGTGAPHRVAGSHGAAVPDRRAVGAERRHPVPSREAHAQLAARGRRRLPRLPPLARRHPDRLRRGPEAGARDARRRAARRQGGPRRQAVRRTCPGGSSTR